MSARFMTGILNRRYWMLKGHQVTNIKVCAFPPSKLVLNGILVGALANQPPGDAVVDKQIRRTISQLKLRPPAKEWLLVMLSQLVPEHRIFTKDYTRDEAKNKPRVEEDQQVSNPDGFFDNLKLPYRKKKGRVLNLVPKKVQHEARLGRMGERLGQLQAKFEKAKAEDLASSEDSEDSSDSSMVGAGDRNDAMADEQEEVKEPDGANVIQNAEALEHLDLNRGGNSMAARVR